VFLARGTSPGIKGTFLKGLFILSDILVIPGRLGIFLSSHKAV
jgi:hypothetical protein